MLDGVDHQVCLAQTLSNRVLEHKINRVDELPRLNRRLDEPLLKVANPASLRLPDTYEILINAFRLTRFPCNRQSFTLVEPLNEHGA